MGKVGLCLALFRNSGLFLQTAFLMWEEGLEEDGCWWVVVAGGAINVVRVWDGGGGSCWKGAALEPTIYWKRQRRLGQNWVYQGLQLIAFLVMVVMNQKRAWDTTLHCGVRLTLQQCCLAFQQRRQRTSGYCCCCWTPQQIRLPLEHRVLLLPSFVKYSANHPFLLQHKGKKPSSKNRKKIHTISLNSFWIFQLCRS